MILQYEDLYDDYDGLEEEIEELRGTIGRGDCLYCGARGGMVYTGDICFVCEKCGQSVHEDTYYTWAAGYEITFED